MNDLDELTRIAAELEPDALAVLVHQAQRLAGGRKAYGALDLATDPRDWSEEALFELLDYTVYRAAEVLQARRSEYCRCAEKAQWTRADRCKRCGKRWPS